MDDHLFFSILDYGKCELIPRIQHEFNETGALTHCPSYSEALDFCQLLNIAAKYAGGGHWIPSDLLQMKI